MTGEGGMRKRLARIIARELGDDFDHALTSKSAWTAAQGQSGGRFRDVNEPLQSDYLDAVDAILLELREPDDGILRAIMAGMERGRVTNISIGAAMEVRKSLIDHIRGEG